MDADEMTCTLAVTQVKDDKTLSTVRTDTTEGLSDYMYPIPITSATHHPKPTKTEPSTTKEATSSSEPKPTSTSSVHSEHTKPKDKPSHTLITTTELVFVAPDPTQIAITEPSTTTADSSSSAYTPTVVTPSAPGSNAGPAPTRNAMLLGAAAVVGGALIF